MKDQRPNPNADPARTRKKMHETAGSLMHVETAVPLDTSLADEHCPLLEHDELSQETLDSPISESWFQKLKPVSVFFLMCVYAILLWSIWNYLNTRLGLPHHSSANDFSLDYVEKVLRNISQKPHMYNSDENLRVREFLIGELLSISESSRNEIQVWHDDSTNVIVNNNFFESSNIVVRIRGNASRDSALLVSAHYDSTSLSHGVTDDGIAVAVIRSIGNSTSPQMDIIFNINNGEEMGLLGGYSFLLHPWFKYIKAFINLEGTGAASGTRSVLFRTNSFEVAKLCEAAPYPHASIIFNQLMKYVKSDTDYRPYGAIARLPGVDIAFYSYRYLYHTPHDNMDNYKSQSALQMGLNLAAMARKAIYAPEWLHKLPPVPVEEDPLGVLSTPDFVYYDLYGYYFVIFKGLSFATWQAIMIFACILLALGSVLTNYISTGSLAIWKDRLRSFLREYLFVLFAFFFSLSICFTFSVAKWLINPSSSYGQYKLTIVGIAASVVAALSLSCLLWPNVEQIMGLSELECQSIVLPESISDEDFLPHQDTNRMPDYLFIHRGLLGFWCTLLSISWLLSIAFKISSLYFVYDWTFSCLISVVVLYNLPSLVEMDVGPLTITNTLSEGFWSSSKKVLLSNSWIIGLVISTSIPSLMTMDIIMATSIGLPSLIAEGLSSIAADMCFGFLITLLLMNMLPGIKSTKAIFFLLVSFAILIPTFLTNIWVFPFSPNTPQKFMFTHTWDISADNSEVELMVSPTMSSADFIKVSREWMSPLSSPNCTSHADKRDSTSCMYSASHPVLKGPLSDLDPHSLITLHWERGGFLKNNEIPENHGDFIAAKWQGSPESRICSIQIIRDSIEPLSVELDVKSNGDWVTIPSFPNPSINLTEPIFLMKRSLGSTRRIDSTLILKGSVSGLEKLKIRCFHSEVEGNISSAFFDELDEKKPDWTSFHHGRMGGIILEKTFEFRIQKDE